MVLQHSITVLLVVPSLLHLLLDEPGYEQCKSLKYLCCGGEELPAILQQRFYSHLTRPDAALYNFYGPAEATVDATFWICKPEPLAQRVPIGRPIANTQVYILDEYLQLLPVGVPGELFVGGDALARGYLKRADLTAERFLPNPFSSEDGMRMYRTGDLARYRLDGTIEYLGRRDSQVKVRGVRIEPGEIEAALSEHPAIREVAVVAQKNRQGETRLIAYMVSQIQQRPTVHDMRGYVQTKLPSSMMPSTFVWLEALPLSPNGKLDQRALPASEEAESKWEGALAAPRSPIEEALGGIWADVLRSEQIGITDDFFELGGHSLLATQVMARMRETLRVELPLRALFEAPTIAGLAGRIMAAYQVEQGLLTPPLHPFSRMEDMPLSFAQQRLWFLDQFEPGSLVYTIPLAVRLQGDLKVAALEQSLDMLAQRHEVLRTTFHTVEGRPVQRISPTPSILLPIVDVTSLPENRREMQVQRLVQADALSSFDLARGPLLRTCLLRLNPQEHVLLVNTHHIVSDGWSLGVLLRELSALYASLSSGKPSPLPELAIQYADYTLWQREWLQGEALAAQLSYWREQLAGAPLVLEMPSDRPRPAVLTWRGSRQRFLLPLSLLEALKRLSQRENVTLFMTLLAAWQTLLWRYSGQDDLLVGTPIANRTSRQVEELIGCFINTLVLRGDLSGDPSFVQLLKRTREVALEAYAHQDLPFESLVEELQPQRDLSRTPLFQVMFALQNTSLVASELPGLRLCPVEVEQTTAKFELTLTMQETARGLLGVLEYNTDLFEATTIAHMTHQLQVLLESIVADPRLPISRLPLLTQAEQEQLQMDWNKVRATSPTELCLHQLFEAQVASTPDAIALSLEGEQLSYQELNERANVLAHQLQARGVKPDVCVGLCLERSLELVVGLLAILKAGGAYVPLDPTYPRERLAFLLSDAQVAVLLTQERYLSQFPQHQALVFCLPDQGSMLFGEKSTNPISGVTPQHLSYIIYTSGSTGTPKGVMVTHANADRLFTATQPLFHFTAQDVWTLFHSVAFDFSVWEIWGALLSGGHLVLVPYWLSRSPQDFADLLTREYVTVLNQTPSAFRQLLSVQEVSGWQQKLRLLIFGGEALDLPSVQLWWQRYGSQGPLLVNMYGITETTVHVTAQLLEASNLRLRSHSLIGNALSDLQIYVLDTHLQPVPIGIPGELYVGGAGLTRGYLGQPALTAERFVPHPWSQVPGCRLYKTGDLARRLSDGTLEYLGRNDEQIKLRGFRIESGEIEAALVTHPAIRAGIVLIREDGTGDRRLVAYIVPHPQQAPTVSELRDHLQAKLPDHMLPAAFVLLDSLPLTAHGKLDRRALPVPGLARPDLEEPYVAPRTPIEEILAGIWGQVLKGEQVGIHDNFFALGGDSIRSIQVLALARERGLRCSLQQLFQQQTIARLAQTLTLEMRRDGAPASRQPFSLITSEDRQLLPDGVEDAYPLTLLQAGMLFHSAYSPESSAYHNVSSYHLQARFDLRCLDTALQQVIARHEVLRIAFDLTSFSQSLQLVYQQIEVVIPCEDLRHLAPVEQEGVIARVIEEEKQHKFDWTQAPLLRMRVHLRTEATFQVTLTEHHAILDGWSVASLFTELFERYLALLETVDVPSLEPPTVMFRDYVAIEQESLASEEAEAYWKERLSKSTRTLLPYWRSARQTSDPAQMHLVEVLISPDVVEGLQRLARAAAVPLKSVLLAAHLNVLRVLGAEADVLTGLVTNGRPETLDGEQVLGLFLNVLPHRQQLSGGSWLDLVRHTFECEQEMLPWRRYPLAQIQRKQGGQPLFETAFNFMHFHVYHRLDESSQLRIVEGKAFAQSNLALVAHFSQALASKQVQLRLECNDSRFEDEQIEAIGGYYARTLTAMASAPHTRYEQQCLLSDQEQQRVLSEWNTTSTHMSWSLCFHERVEAQVQKTPDAVAVVCGEEQLTYQELNRRANLVAQQLRERNIGSEVLVAVLDHRSCQFLIAMLAIFKAGGCYLPLDPSHPTTRLRQMLEGSGCGFVLVTSTLVPLLDQILEGTPADTHPLVLSFEELLEHGYNRENIPTRTTPQQLAYVIYTSGSTGSPKGVMIEERGMLNHLFAMIRALPLTKGDTVAQTASQGFDISVWQFLATLLVGGRIQIFPDDVSHDPAQLLTQVEQSGVSILEIVPSLLGVLLDVVEQGTTPHPLLKGLRWLLPTGETLPPALCRRWLDVYPHIPLLNAYGPAECSDDVTLFPLAEPLEELATHTPIGRPVDNMRLYLLDRTLTPLPIGVAGELYIGGIGVGRGYLGDIPRTSETFVPDPFSEEPGMRLYKTGDLARYLPDGTLVFLGRSDQQVKIRGYRIEPGEIEAVLRRHPDVQDAVVVPLEEIIGHTRLIAYLVPHHTWAASTHDWRGYLKERLPDYMTPAAFVELDALPLTPNGKIDRRALPAPDEVRSEVIAAFAAPQSSEEKILAKIWCEVLALPRVGRHDNFFEAGGDLILSLQIIHRAYQAGLHLTPKQLFQHPTIAELARITDAPPTTGAQQDLVVGPVPLTPGQQWFFERIFADLQHWDQDVVRQPADTTSLQRWTRQLIQYAQSPELLEEVAYWLHERRRTAPAVPLDLAGDCSMNTEEAATSVSVALSTQETHVLLHELPDSYQIKIHEVLLTALAQTWASWVGRSKLLVDIAHHGQEAVLEEFDGSRMVGRFTVLYPQVLDLERGVVRSGPGATLRAIKEQVRDVPQQGLGYGLLRYLSERADIQTQLEALPQAEICFHYPDKFDSILQGSGATLPRLAHESNDPSRNSGNVRGYLLDITCLSVEGCLQVQWTYCSQMHRRETIELLAQRHIEALRMLIAHCSTFEAGGYTPSDFQGVELSQAQIDRIMTRLHARGRPSLQKDQ